MCELAKGLEDKSAIPSVAAQMELILALQTEQWWSDVSLPMLENVRINLRDLTRFIDKDAGLIDVFTNFKDEIGEYNIFYGRLVFSEILRLVDGRPSGALWFERIEPHPET